jgi:F-type H+-transporting ATPase subunit gamma
MESPQNIKKRLKSVNNIGQITKAMELVSATKMRKSQQIALDSRPYAFSAMELLAKLTILPALGWSASGGEKNYPDLMKTRKQIKRVLFVLIASDKGLAGAFNSSVFKKFEKHFAEDARHQGEEKLFLAVGEKSSAYLLKKGFKVIKKFAQVGDFTTPEQAKPIADFITQGYLNKDWDRVIVISTHFKTALRQEPHVRRVLPIDFDHISDTITEIIPERGKFAELIKENNISFVPDKLKIKESIIEPSTKIVLEKLASHLFFMQIYHLILEANASEHSARRMAMKTASDNAKDLEERLNLQYNKSRQQKITTEISEISAGAEALN